MNNQIFDYLTERFEYEKIVFKYPNEFFDRMISVGVRDFFGVTINHSGDIISDTNEPYEGFIKEMSDKYQKELDEYYEEQNLKVYGKRFKIEKVVVYGIYKHTFICGDKVEEYWKEFLDNFGLDETFERTDNPHNFINYDESKDKIEISWDTLKGDYTDDEQFYDGFIEIVLDFIGYNIGMGYGMEDEMEGIELYDENNNLINYEDVK